MCMNLIYNPSKRIRHPECARDCIISIISYTLPQLCKVSIIIPILQMGKLRPRDILKVTKHIMW